MPMPRTYTFLAAGLLGLAALAAPSAFAQPQQPQQPDPNQQQGRRQFDPAQMRQRMMDGLKDALGASDDEMKVLYPAIEKVMQLQRDSRGGSIGALFRRGQGNNGGGGGGGFRGGFGADPNAQPSATQMKLQELEAAVDNKDTPPSDLKARLAALRQARDQARADLVKAQAELQSLLTQRQEAALVVYGILD